MTHSRQRPHVHIPQGFEAFGSNGRPGTVSLDRHEFRALETRRKRLVAVGIGFAVVYFVMAFQLLHLSVFSGGSSHDAVRQQTVSVDKHFRRDIVDRNGQLVATNLTTVALYADTRQILDADEAARDLMTIFPSFDYQQLKQKLSTGRAYVVLRHDLTPAQHANVHGLGIPGFRFETEPRRVYPQGVLASHVVGFVGSGNNGLIGLEKALNDQLLSTEDRAPVKLSLDLRVQYIMRDELLNAMDEFKAKAASGIVMDVRTGEILSLVSLPDFDPNDIDRATKNQLFNRTTLGVYEMGSTFKAFNTALALDSGNIDINDQFDATKPYQVANRRIHDLHPENRWLTVSEVFMVSSNIGSARIAHKVGVEKQTEFLGRLGLFDKPRLELPEVGGPLLPIKWGPTETATVSYGHGISVSPLSISTAMASLVNGGFKLAPTLLSMEGSEPSPREQVIEAVTSRQMRRLMRQVVTQGTGGKADVPGYSVGGKTGTADKPSRGGYDRRALITSFAGIFPSENPRYLVLAVLDEPKGIVKTHGYRGAGWNAAPTVGAVIRRSAPVLGIRPSADVSPFADAIEFAELGK